MRVDLRVDPDATLSNRADPARLQFRLIDVTGKAWFVHMLDLSKRTDNPNFAWSGTEKQAHNVRAKYPHARQMPLVRKSHKQNAQ